MIETMNIRTLQKNSEKKRDAYLDFVKSYAIFLVVLGHVIQTFNASWENDNVFLAIYMFHMPLFIWISGRFFVCSAHTYSFRELLKKRFVQLMLPSLTMGFLNFLIIGGGKLLRHEIIDLGYSLNLIFTGLWFLTVLFIFTITGKVIYDAFEKWKFYFVLSLVWCVLYVLPDVWIFNNMEYLLPFFVGGMICRNVNWKQTKWCGLPIVMFVFVICSHYFNYGKAMYNIGDDVFSLQYLKDTLLRLVCGLSGILLSLYLIKYSLHVLKNMMCVIKIGMMTLPIYVLHQNILVINRFLKIRTDNILVEIVIAIVVTALTIVIYKALHKNKVLAALLFGEVELSKVQK